MITFGRIDRHLAEAREGIVRATRSQTRREGLAATKEIIGGVAMHCRAAHESADWLRRVLVAAEAGITVEEIDRKEGGGR